MPETREQWVLNELKCTLGLTSFGVKECKRLKVPNQSARTPTSDMPKILSGPSQFSDPMPINNKQYRPNNKPHNVYKIYNIYKIIDIPISLGMPIFRRLSFGV